MDAQRNSYHFIGPFKQVLTLSETPSRGPLNDSHLGIMEHVGILIKDKQIYEIGKHTDLISKAHTVNAEIRILEGGFIALPGFIDAHTHICFSGSRANDYAMRNAGATYLEIAAQGGGIWDTVNATRKASQVQLVNETVNRLKILIKSGITTVEVKSGYGLSVEEELKMLRSIKSANEFASQDLIPTCLAAHILPKDYEGSHKDYLQEISEKLFPVMLTEQLANRVDAFVEEGAYYAEVISPYLLKAKSMGFDVTVHADQFSTGGSAVAVNHGAISADHLEASTQKEIELLAGSEVIATALPGASIGLGCAFTPARELLNAGCSLAIASDWNPGSAPMGDLMVQACILATFEKLTNAEVLAAITTRAADALGLTDRGNLVSGKLADINIYQTDHFNEICYHQGMMKPRSVWKRGKEVYNSEDQT